MADESGDFRVERGWLPAAAAAAVRKTVGPTAIAQRPLRALLLRAAFEPADDRSGASGYQKGQEDCGTHLRTSQVAQ
jgi:hypothetical protein